MTLTKVSYSMIDGASVNVVDFGADPTGATDSTSAVQAALDYVIAQGNVGLTVSGTFLISGTVSINKTSGDRTPTYIFGGGTFYKNNAGVMFNATHNATSEVFFNNIRFLGDIGANVTAIQCNQQFIRGYFYNCSFEYLDVCFDSSAYLMQSFYISGCDFSNIKSWVIDCGTSGGYPIGSAADVHVSQCQCEEMSTGGFFRGAAGAFTVKDCVMENFYGSPVFYIYNCSGTLISGNYFEDCTHGIVVFPNIGSTCSGLTLESNNVNLATGTSFVLWPAYLYGACTTISNTVNGGQLNDTSQVTNGGVVTVNDWRSGFSDGSATYPVATYVANTFTPVVEGTSTAGTATYSDQTGYFTKINNVVTFTLSVSWSSHTGTGNILISGFPYAPKNAYFAVSVLPILFNPTSGHVLTAGFLDGLPHVFPLSIRSDGASGNFAFFNLPSYTSGGLVISGSYLTN